MQDSTKAMIVAGGVAGVALLAWLAWHKGKKVLSTSLNPASDQNIAYGAATGVGQAVGLVAQNQTLGTAIYDSTHNNDGSFNWFGLASKPPVTSTPAPSTANKDFGGLNFGIDDVASWDLPQSGFVSDPIMGPSSGSTLAKAPGTAS